MSRLLNKDDHKDFEPSLAHMACWVLSQSLYVGNSNPVHMIARMSWQQRMMLVIAVHVPPSHT